MKHIEYNKTNPKCSLQDVAKFIDSLIEQRVPVRIYSVGIMVKNVYLSRSGNLVGRKLYNIPSSWAASINNTKISFNSNDIWLFFNCEHNGYVIVLCDPNKNSIIE